MEYRDADYFALPSISPDALRTADDRDLRKRVLDVRAAILQELLRALKESGDKFVGVESAIEIAERCVRKGAGYLNLEEVEMLLGLDGGYSTDADRLRKIDESGQFAYPGGLHDVLSVVLLMTAEMACGVISPIRGRVAGLGESGPGLGARYRLHDFYCEYSSMMYWQNQGAAGTGVPPPFEEIVYRPWVEGRLRLKEYGEKFAATIEQKATSLLSEVGRDSRNSAACAIESAGQGCANRFRRLKNNSWDIAFDGCPVYTEKHDLAGLRIIHYLLANPEEDGYDPLAFERLLCPPETASGEATLDAIANLSVVSTPNRKDDPQDLRDQIEMMDADIEKSQNLSPEQRAAAIKHRDTLKKDLMNLSRRNPERKRAFGKHKDAFRNAISHIRRAEGGHDLARYLCKRISFVRGRAISSRDPLREFVTDPNR